MADSPRLSEDVKGYLDEANATSEPARTAWLAFLFLLAYVIVTLASVSHKDLLLNSPVKLPIINTEIPLVGFFQYAPAMLLLVYLSLLVQHVIVARKYRRFTDAIVPLELKTGVEHPARERVHAYAFSQILAGPRPHRITKLMMQLIVYVTFALLPIATLLYFQIKFLPYHEVWITCWHRFAVILGFAMLILLTPIMQHAPPRRKWDLSLGPPAEAWEVSGWQVFMILLLLPVVLGFSWLIATVPDEWIDRRLGFVAPKSAAIGPAGEAKLLNPIVRRLFYDLLPDDGSKGWWRRWLLSYRILIVEDTDLGVAEPANLVLRERDFRYALLNRSDFHRADLTWADLRAAQMWRATVRGKLNDTQLEGAVLKEAELQGAQMASASLQGADLTRSKLQGANLSYAKLQGANLRGAQLQGADLSFAQLEGADLEGALLLDADLDGAELQGAALSGAEIWLAKFPRNVAEQRPVPLGLPDMKMSPTAEAKVQLKQGIEADITDPELRGVVMARLGNILSNEPQNWDDARNWQDYVQSAKPPSPKEIVEFHAKLACNDTGGSIATALAVRAKDFESEHFGKGYAKPLAEALLDETCQAGKALTAETRAILKGVAAPSNTRAPRRD
jgi:hypothetical protein